ncbi:MAG TPA: ABC-type transport auxiliary lipoprotein family protein [Thermoanaerobaculia bacterium]
MTLVLGCSFFSKSKSQIYSLDRIAGPVVSVSGTPIAIDSIELPPGFDRKDIVVRKANNQLDVRGTQQWSATLGQLVLHTLAFDLADRLPVGMMILPGAAKPAAVRSINLAFEEIAAGPDAKVVIDARWETRHERIEVPIASLDSANVASGMSQALATLADRIASPVR